MTNTMQKTSENAGSTRSRGTIRRTRILMIAVGLIAILWQLAGTANAVSVRPSGYHPGTATVPTARLVTGPYLVSPVRTVYENSTYRSSWQYVCVNHQQLGYGLPVYSGGVLLSSGGWKVTNYRQVCQWISPAASSVRDEGAAFDLRLWPHEDISLRVRITWQLPNGTLLGQKVYAYDRPTDYLADSSVWIMASGYNENVWYFNLV